MSTIRLYDVTVSFPASQTEGAISGSLGGIFGGSRRAENLDMPPGSGTLEPRRHVALDRVNLEIHHGETMGILGPSGCGKTTLLRAIAGLIPIDSGVITYDDQ